MFRAPGATTGQLTLPLDAGRRVFQVHELNSAVQNLFESEFRSIWVAGEISGCRIATSGHFYFFLKDTQAQLKCALFKGSARYAKFKPQDGLAVLARGNLEVYEARGEYQLIVEMLEPQGVGALQLAFEQLKRKLAAEGLFDQARKRPLPRLPTRIGIVTSPAGAVIRDILHVLERRFPGLHIRLFPAQVQGEGAATQICRALTYFSESGWAEVVIVARGGGSLEDLWTFNEEAIARVIAQSAIPVISAIGHETDFTIADFVADHRAPTPSAAAEIVICTRESLLEQINSFRAKLVQAMRYKVISCSRDLYRCGTERATILVERGVSRRAQLIDDLENQLIEAARLKIESLKSRLEDLRRRVQAKNLQLRFAHDRHRYHLLGERLLKCIETRLGKEQRQQERLHLRLTQLSPLTVLGRGYAIVEDSRKHILRSTAEISAGEPVRILLQHGSLGAIVSKVNE